jgi:hypothetical protein
VAVEKLEHLDRHAPSLQMLAEEADSVAHVVLQDSDRLHDGAAIRSLKGRDATIAHVMGAKPNGMSRAFERP